MMQKGLGTPDLKSKEFTIKGKNKVYQRMKRVNSEKKNNKKNGTSFFLNNVIKKVSK